ncbi:type I-E CRISPR-associated protein Cse2/CasB [Thorsellia kenyensis]|uniref:Type I-E CRISPR-associated protein Cse2/CasB n=1 Tax=Thorsellia kenyensis TaxID=1549888 RepID=A0ABV6C731_9GAMM
MEKNEFNQKIISWWERLHHHKEPFLPKSFKAELKRCDSLLSVMLTSSFHQFRNEVLSEVENPDLEVWAVIVCLFAHIKTKTVVPESIAKSLGVKQNGSEKAKMSELRFNQLQKVLEKDEFLIRMIRAIKLLDGTACPKTLMSDIQQWFKEKKYPQAIPPSQQLSVKWALDYYQ